MSEQIREKKIIVYLRGGVVEDVKKFPENLEVIVEVHDYDILDDEDKSMRLDENKEAFGLTQY